MSSVYENFRHLFNPVARVRPVANTGVVVETNEDRRSRIADMRTFVSTQAYGEFRERLSHLIDQNEPNPEHGTDVSACFVFTQKGLRMALRVLDDMTRLTEEKIADE